MQQELLLWYFYCRCIKSKTPTEVCYWVKTFKYSVNVVFFKSFCKSSSFIALLRLACWGQNFLNQLKIKYVTTFNEVDMEHEIQVERVWRHYSSLLFRFLNWNSACFCFIACDQNSIVLRIPADFCWSFETPSLSVQLRSPSKKHLADDTRTW